MSEEERRNAIDEVVFEQNYENAEKCIEDDCYEKAIAHGILLLAAEVHELRKDLRRASR